MITADYSSGYHITSYHGNIFLTVVRLDRAPTRQVIAWLKLNRTNFVHACVIKQPLYSWLYKSIISSTFLATDAFRGNCSNDT